MQLQFPLRVLLVLTLICGISFVSAQLFPSGLLVASLVILSTGLLLLGVSLTRLEVDDRERAKLLSAGVFSVVIGIVFFVLSVWSTSVEGTVQK